MASYSIATDIQESMVDRVKPIVEEIDSARIVPPKEIRDTSSIYPQDSVYKTQKHLVITTNDGYSKLDLTDLYAQLPQSLAGVIGHEIYRPPELENNLVCILFVESSFIDSETNSLNLQKNRVSEEVFERVYRSITSTNHPVGLVSEDNVYDHKIDPSTNSATVWVPKVLLQSRKKYGTRYVDTFYDLINSQMVFYINKILAETDSHLKLSVKSPSSDQFDKSRVRFMGSNIRYLSLDCTNCGENSSVVVSFDKDIPFCSSCNTFFKQIDLTYESTLPDEALYVSEFVSGKWQKYTEDKYDIQTAQDLYSMEQLGETVFFSQNSQVFVKHKSADIWFTLDIPYGIEGQEIEVSDEPLCYLCSSVITDVAYLPTTTYLEIDEFYSDDIYLCSSCVSEVTEHFMDVIGSIDNFGSKIVSQNI